MTKRENTLAILNRGKPERIGLYDTVWWETQQKWREQGHLTRTDPETGERVDVSPEEWFGYDLVAVGSWHDLLPIAGCNELIEENDEWSVSKNGAGAILKWWKHKSGTPEHIGFTMTDRGVWERDYRSLLLDVDERRLKLDEGRALMEKHRGSDALTAVHNGFLWELMRSSVGDITMLEALALDPDWIHDYNRVNTDFQIAHYRRLFEVCGSPDVAFIYDDMAYKNGPFCSPAMLEELYLPYHRELVDFFHGLGMPVILHSCGGIEKALPFVVAAGFDAINPLEVKAGCDLLRFAEEYGDRLAFVGGFDARIFESGDRDLIKKEIIRLTKGMRERGARWLFGSDHSLSSRVDYDDYVYALEVYRECM